MSYTVDTYGGGTETVTGSDLKQRAVKLEPRSFQLVFYTKQ
jgi:hypothetical protein